MKDKAPIVYDLSSIELPNGLRRLCEFDGVNEDAVLAWYRDQVEKKIYEREGTPKGLKVRIIRTVYDLGETVVLTQNQRKIEKNEETSRKAEERITQGHEKEKTKIERKTRFFLQKLDEELDKSEQLCGQEPILVRQILEDESRVVAEAERVTSQTKKTVEKVGFSGGVLLVVGFNDFVYTAKLAFEAGIRTAWMGIREIGMGAGWLVVNFLAKFDRSIPRSTYLIAEKISETMKIEFDKYKTGMVKMFGNYKDELNSIHNWMFRIVNQHYDN